jgi:hypothetical protein
MQRWQHNWALRTRAKIYFSFRFKHYCRLTISAMHDYMKSKCIYYQTVFHIRKNNIFIHLLVIFSMLPSLHSLCLFFFTALRTECHMPAVRCAQIYIPCTYKLLSCTKLREWFGVNFWQMLQDTFATSQIHFVFEITLVALKYKQYNFKLSPKMNKRRWNYRVAK